MYAVSDDYKAVIKLATRLERMTGTITLADATEIGLTDDIIAAGSMSVDSRCIPGSDFDIGSAEAACLKIGLLLDEDLAGAVIEPVYGLLVDAETDTWEDIPLGIFYVIEAPRENNVVRVTAIDGMYLLERAPVEPPASGTPYDYLDYAATLAGLTLAQNEATIDAMPNGTHTITYPEYSEIETLRDLIMWASQLLGGYACINMDGELEIRHMLGSAVRDIDAACRTSTDISDVTKFITSLEWMINGIGHLVQNTPDNGGLLSLEDNPLIRNETTAVIEGTIMPAILASVDGISYRPFSAELCRPDPALEAGDLVTLSEGVGGTGTNCLITNNFWQYRRSQSLSGAGRDNSCPTTKTQQEKKDIIRAARGYIMDLIAQRILAGEKVLVGNPTGKRAEIYLSNGSPLVDMYDDTNTLRSSWGYNEMLWYDANGDLAMLFDQYGISFGDSRIQKYTTPGGTRTGIGFYPL